MQPESPSIAVIIPAFNAERTLERAVRSVFGTGYSNLEVIMVEDGSRDGTLRVAEQLAAHSAGRCRVLRHPGGGNRGVSASRNLGIRQSDSEWLAFLDADDEYLACRFQQFQSEIETGRALDGLYDLAEARLETGGKMPAPSALGEASMPFGIDRPATGTQLLEELLGGRCWATSAIILRRDLLAKTGVFPEGQPIAEDCDLWFRVAAMGQLLPGNLQQPVSIYWRHASNTYRYEHRHRLAMLKSMLRAWRWAEHAGCGAQMLEVFDRCVPPYLERSLLAAREAGQTGLAAKLLWAMLRHRPSGLRRGRALRHAARLPLDLLQRRARSAIGSSPVR